MATEHPVDHVLDLRRVPADALWERIMAKVRQLASAAAAETPGPVEATAPTGANGATSASGQWSLELLLDDTPEVAIELPYLLRYLAGLGVQYDASRKPDGTQAVLLRPQSVPF